jgi:TonB family protein
MPYHFQDSFHVPKHGSLMTKRILLIDYESRAAERARGVLREPDYEIVAAHDGEEALNAFSSSRYDLVLLSGMLPRLPSAEVIREIRRRGGATAPPILLMVSGYKGSNTKADAQRVGAFDLLARPFSDEALRRAATEAIAATGAAARPARADADAGEASALTSSDIFSDILEEVDRDVPGPAPAARISQATELEVEKRLRDTLSGVRPKPAAGPAKSPARSTNEEVERLLSQTLSGIRTPARQKAAPVPQPASRKPVETAAKAPEPAPAREVPGPDHFGQYEILERIASGGMAELFRARRSGVEGFQKIVAIKKILPHIAGDEEFITMFADEAKLAAQLSHPNIVHIFDLGKIEGGGYFIAMEHVEGRDLRSILHMVRETGLKMPVPLAVSIAAKVAAALDYAHRRHGDDGQDLNIVHRDVSPPNILVSTDGDIKLCDFGIAKAASKVSRTESGALKGKVPYMSPEQAWGKPVDQRSDIYSLGTVLFEMLTGRKLFQGDSDLNVLEKVRAGDVALPSSLNPDVPPALDAAALKALARDPDERYPRASDLLRDLEAVLRTYEPPPSSADLAAYVRRLETEEASRREARAREEQAPAAVVPPAKKPAVPEIRIPLPPPPPAASERSTPPPAAPAPEPVPPVVRQPEPVPAAVFATSFPGEAERKKRAGLYLLIAAAALALVIGGWLVLRKPSTSLPPSAAVTAPPATAVVVSAMTPLPSPPPSPATDAKAIQEEAQRQLAARRKEMQKAAAAAARPPGAGGEKAPSAAPVAPTSLPAQPSPEVRVAAAQPAAPEPTAAPVVEAPPTAPPRAPAKPEAAEVSRGDLVGPGEGVVEPVFLSSPRIAYPPAARQQGITGKVVVLVLVNEEGTVTEAKLQQGLTRFGVNEAVVDSIRHAKFRPATKNGIPVKMWRTVVVDVKP